MEVSMLISWLSFGVLCIFLFPLNWNYIRYWRKGLPPGTMGWPFFGDTQVLRARTRDHEKTKSKERRELSITIGKTYVACPQAARNHSKYGNLFKSRILGCPTVIYMDPEINGYILLSEAKGLASGYPQSLLDILGKHNIASLSGLAHKQSRGAFMLLTGPSTVKEQLLPKINKYTRLFLQNWDRKTIDIQEKIQEMAFFLFFNQIFGDQPCVIYEALKAEFDKLLLGIFSLPINLPGTNYYKGLQARKNIIKLLTKVVKSRRAASSTFYHDDMLNSLFANKESNYGSMMRRHMIK